MSNLKEDLIKRSELFIDSINSEMYFESEVDSDSMSFGWLEELEFAFPYLDNIIRNPRLALVTEEDIVKIEKAKKIGVASVKNLSKNTHFIDKITENQEVQPSKILIERREETYNTYENRFIYTLIYNIVRFLIDKEEELESFDTKHSKSMEYYGSAKTDLENVNIEIKINSKELPKGQSEDEFLKELNKIKERFKTLQDYISDWRRSEFMVSLDKEHVAFVIPPIKKTNMILKNPNFQIASKLWQYLLNYENDDSSLEKEGLESRGDNLLIGVLNDAFLTNFYIMDSISKRKRDQKDKLKHYALMMITNQIRSIVELLIDIGYDIKEDELLKLIADEIKKEKTKKTAGVVEIEKKFKSAMDEFLKEAKEGLDVK